jgi:hypothetical protein
MWSEAGSCSERARAAPSSKRDPPSWDHPRRHAANDRPPQNPLGAAGAVGSSKSNFPACEPEANERYRRRGAASKTRLARAAGQRSRKRTKDEHSVLDFQPEREVRICFVFSCFRGSSNVYSGVERDLISTDGEFEAAVEGQRHGPQSVAWIVNEFEVVEVGVPKLRRVVADDDGAVA